MVRVFQYIHSAMPQRFFAVLIAALFAACACCFGKPTLFIIGDSTVRNSSAGQMGWGDPLVAHFDPAKIEVVNRAIGGRSSRTFLTEGRWDAVMAHLKPGDFVLIQFGHNDGGALNDDRCRASLRGNGDGTETITRKTDGKSETVMSFGAYLRRYIRDARSKGATPIIVSPIPRNIWKDGRIGRAGDSHGLWARQAAEQEMACFIDFNNILADRYEAIGAEKTAGLFAGSDHTHTSAVGAEFNAGVMATAIRGLADCQLAKELLAGDLWLPSIFSDHMVLQRGMPVPVWGTATPGVKVTVKLAGQSAVANAGEDGRWRVDLAALTDPGPFTLEVSTPAASCSFTDVLAGEVWLCSGQSNMDFTLASTAKRSFSGVTGWKNEVAAARHPKLRMFTADWTMREHPQREVPGKWAVCDPENAADFSAVAYYFGREIQQALGVPVGLVTCAYGASTIEAWIGEDALTKHPQFDGLLKEFARKRTAFRDDPKAFESYGAALAKWKGGRAPRHPDPVQDQHNPCVLHNGMIAPIAPYALRGAIWYQGESNLNTRGIYPDLQKALIEDWRDLWGNPALPFYYVQLAAYKAPSKAPAPGGQIAAMREAQATSLAIPHTGMAVTIDIGEEKDIHPRNKLDVGKRLARLALAGSYQKPVVPCGPLFRDASIGNQRIRIRFDHAGGGLVAKGGSLKQFAIAGPDRNFVHAEAVIDGDSVVVSNPAITHPAYVRYAWADNPLGANLSNAEGLPAAPFRNDP
jgi:sialate O-acetylesterase